jgi:hypothetical protein
VQQLKTWSILFLVCSALSACKNGPKVSFCILDSANKVLRCSDPDKVPFDLSLEMADNYGCMAPDDWEQLLKAGVQTSVQMRAVKKEYEARVAAHPVMATKWKRN